MAGRPGAGRPSLTTHAIERHTRVEMCGSSIPHNTSACSPPVYTGIPHIHRRSKQPTELRQEEEQTVLLCHLVPTCPRKRHVAEWTATQVLPASVHKTQPTQLWEAMRLGCMGLSSGKVNVRRGRRYQAWKRNGRKVQSSRLVCQR